MKIKLILAILFGISISNFAQLNLGPIVGGVTQNSAIVLVKTYKPQTVQIELFSEKNPQPSIYSETVMSDTNNYNYVKIPIQNLSPNTNYYYRAIVDGMKSNAGTHLKLSLQKKITVFLLVLVLVSNQVIQNGIPKFFP